MDRKGLVSVCQENNIGPPISSVDRISPLPDSILCHILSFLPTEDSVATCILARRWGFLWTEIPTWDFDDDDFEYDDHDYYHNNTRYKYVINRFMFLHRVQNITSFRLRLVDQYKDLEYAVESWIFSAIARNVQNIDLSFHHHSVKLPPCLFTCKTLVNLSLHKKSRGIPMDGTIYLPLLKKLCLYYFKFESDESLPHLLSGCPMLEELAISDHRNLHCCHISSPTIQVLTVGYRFENGAHSRDRCSLEINAPALRYLKIDDFLALHIPMNISAETLNSLTNADILFHTHELPAEYTIRLLNNVYNNVCNVKRLSFEIDRTVFGDMEPFSNSIFGSSALRFNNLTKLDLRADWFFLMKFLEAADNLEVLILREVGDDHVISWEKPQIVPMCLISHLTAIVIHRFLSQKEDFAMARYLLKNAKVLKSLKIPHNERVLRFPRGSKVCELSFF